MGTNEVNQYTLVVSTYNREETLLNHLNHWITCENIYEIHLVYHDPNRDPSQKLRSFISNNNIIFRKQLSNKISNRYSVPAIGFSTEAIFTVDDDFVLDCRLVDIAFNHWYNSANTSNTIVGFAPRMVNLSEHFSAIPYKWNKACEICSYNFIFVTKGSFIHKKYYSIYFEEKYATIRSLVDEYITGEDLLMSYVFHDQNYKYNYDLIAIEAINFTHKINGVSKPFAYNIFDLIKSTTDLNSLTIRSSYRRKYIIESIYQNCSEISYTNNKWIIVSNSNVSIRNIKGENCLTSGLKCDSSKYIMPDTSYVLLHFVIVFIFMLYYITKCCMITFKRYYPFKVSLCTYRKKHVSNKI